MKVYRSDRIGEKIIETYDKLLEEWECEVTEHDIQGTYGTTHVIETGNKVGMPLILFHGVGDDSALMWIYNAKALGDHFHLYAIDTIGGPGKSRPNVRYDKSFDDILWIDEILDSLKIEKAAVAGVSMGAYLTQLYTLERPERVIQAVSIAGAVPAIGKKSTLGVMLKIFLPEALFPTDNNVIKLIRKMSGSNYSVFTGNPVIMSHYKYLLKGFNNMAMGYHKVRGFTSEEIDRIRDRVIYLVGEEDPFEKLGGKILLQKYNMNTAFYPDAGHGLNHELAEEINKKLIEIFSCCQNKDLLR